MADRKRYTGPVVMGEATAEPEVTISRESNVDLSQYATILANSDAKLDDSGKGVTQGVTINTEAEATIKSRFRIAARQMGRGVQFSSCTVGDPRAAQYNLQNGQTRLFVQTKPKKAANGTAAATKTTPAKSAPAQSGLPKPKR